MLQRPDTSFADDLAKARQAFEADLAEARKAAPAKPAIGRHPHARVADMLLENLPAVGGATGGVLGIAGGLPGSVGGAALGGAAGESIKQLINRLLGRAEPPMGTPAEASLSAAKDIGIEGAIQGGAEGVGGALGAAAGFVAPRLMQSAVKPTLAMARKEGGARAPKLIQTLLEEGVAVTKGGAEKIERLLTATNDEIADALKGLTATISPLRVASRADDVSARVAQQVNPGDDLASVATSRREFLDRQTVTNANGVRVVQRIPVQKAQALKTGTYRALKEKAYGEVKGASIETQKALARGLKEEIANEVPAVAGLNARESKLLAAKDAVGRRVALSGNANPVGFAWVTQRPLTFLAALMDRSPAVKSYLALGLYNEAAKAARVTPQAIRLAVQALANDNGGQEKR